MSDRSQWKKVYSDKTRHKAEIVKSLLESNGLFPVIVDKSVSPYGGFFSQYEVLVESDFVLKAMKLIEDHIHFDHEK